MSGVLTEASLRRIRFPDDRDKEDIAYKAIYSLSEAGKGKPF